MPLKLYNTLKRKKEIFKPIAAGKVGMYSCGPTVYNYAHIGNLRTYITNDIIKKSLRFLGLDVNHVMNLTDVDDKTIKGSQKEGESLTEFTRRYEKIFFEDTDRLNIERPRHVLRATETVQEMLDIIDRLVKKGYAYKSTDGIYFSISKFKNYGKLAQLDKIKDKKERIKADEYDKDNAQDFALWKFHSKEDGPVAWDSKFGKGRPGWHIECSAMSMKVLGPHFDIHTGAIDLIFPHHTNEIAQSEGSTGEKFVNYWMHGGFLTMKEKMSKSLGNVIYLKDLMEKGFSPMDYRYFCLTTHYREPLAFSMENLEAAKTTYRRLKNAVLELKDDGNENEKAIKEFTKAIEDDLNMPKALGAMWKLLRSKEKGKYNAIKRMDSVLSLDLFKQERVEIPLEVEALLNERFKARKAKDWKKSDEIRERIAKMGWKVEDGTEGQTVRKI